MLIGYARVSTLEQTLALQQDALTQAGCERLFTDTASGSLTQRPGLTEALDFARPGDTLVVWRLDRLGRSLRHLIDTVAVLQQRGIGFRSLQEQIDTTTSGGKLVFHVFGALAEFERDPDPRAHQGRPDRRPCPRPARRPTQSHRRQEGTDRPGPLHRQDQLDRRDLQDAPHLPGQAVPVRED